MRPTIDPSPLKQADVIAGTKTDQHYYCSTDRVMATEDAAEMSDMALPVSTKASTVSHKCKEITSRAFCPNVAVLCSEDTTALCREMGFEGGLLQLLKPFGDHIAGRLTIRDSQNISSLYDDYSVRFVPPLRNEFPPAESQQLFDHDHLDRCISNQLSNLGSVGVEENNQLYEAFFRSVLSPMPITTFETFGHPVAEIIAVSSRNEQPIETLSALYQQSNTSAPEFIDKEYLRYYLLVHDEATGDLEASKALYEKMKRHFGVHCNMIQINRKPLGDEPTVRDSIWSPVTTSGSESELRLHNDDAMALQKMARELVASSVIPFMERCVHTWNDQIASQRRGITGRFFSASKKYFSAPNKAAGLLSSSPFSLPGSNSPSRGNYNVQNAWYHHDTHEAQLRKLADFAFMLRDYKCAHTTYDLLKRDFHNDKAWSHLAAAQEMSAASWLMYTEAPISTKSKNDGFDALLDSATYSYISRSSLPTYALRCILINTELLCTQTNSPPAVASDSATKWIQKALNERLVGRLGYALLMQRVSEAFQVHNEIAQIYTWRSSSTASSSSTSLELSRKPPPLVNFNTSRTRKAAFWMLLAAREWSDAGQHIQSGYCLDQAGKLAYTKLEWTKTPAGLYGRLCRSELTAAVEVAAAQVSAEAANTDSIEAGVAGLNISVPQPETTV